MPLPPLPSLTPSAPGNFVRSPVVYEVLQRLDRLIENAEALLRQEADPGRISASADSLQYNAVPLLQALTDSAEDEQLPQEWMDHSNSLVIDLIVSLRCAQTVQRDTDDPNVLVANFTWLERRPGPGRPRKMISPLLLQEICRPSRKVHLRNTSRRLDVSVKTLKTRLREEGIDFKYSDINNRQLDDIVREYSHRNADSGIRYITGHIRAAHNIRVQGSRIYSSVKRVDRLSLAVRAQKTIHRRAYHVSRPNALWHMDGHHKLILWGFVIHGIADGFCRTIVSMRACNNNHASTVLHLFIQAGVKYGEPSRVRADRGKENKGVALYAIAKKGLNRGSFIWGSSTYNTRIERLWVEVGAQFVRPWRGFFFRLEARHQLKRDNPFHLWMIHQLFLDLINADCEEFVEEWNAHPISREGHDQSPQDMRLFGMIDKGIYTSCHEDDCAGIDLETIKNAYGVDRDHTPEVQGEESEDEDISNLDHDALQKDILPGCLPIQVDEEVVDEWEMLETEHDSQFHQSSVGTPRVQSPFADSEQELIFFQTLQEISQECLIPEGYGILQEEWEDGDYPSFEMIRSGRKAGKQLRIQLPDSIWRPRAVLWAQALHVYYCMTNLSS